MDYPGYKGKHEASEVAEHTTEDIIDIFYLNQDKKTALCNALKEKAILEPIPFRANSRMFSFCFAKIEICSLQLTEHQGDTWPLKARIFWLMGHRGAGAKIENGLKIQTHDILQTPFERLFKRPELAAKLRLKMASTGKLVLQ